MEVADWGTIQKRSVFQTQGKLFWKKASLCPEGRTLCRTLILHLGKITSFIPRKNKHGASEKTFTSRGDVTNPSPPVTSQNRLPNAKLGPGVLACLPKLYGRSPCGPWSWLCQELHNWNPCRGCKRQRLEIHTPPPGQEANGLFQPYNWNPCRGCKRQRLEIHTPPPPGHKATRNKIPENMKDG